MHRSISNRALIRGLLAGAVVLAGSSGCSRPDRDDAANEASQPAITANPGDTLESAARATTDPATAASGYQPMARDTVQNNRDARDTASETVDTVAVGDSAQVGKPGERLEGTEAAQQVNEDTSVSQSDSQPIRPPEDTSETSGAGVGSTEMARDTGMAVAQGDTMTSPDTSAIQVSVDTTTADEQTADVAVESRPTGDTAVADTAVAVGDSAAVDKPGERLEPEVATAETAVDTSTIDADRVRPPEDSTEVLGNVTTEKAKAETDETESRDAAPVAAAAVTSTGNAVTGANAVAQMSRQGQSCAVATDPADIRDLASSPATLNPCGTGTMTLPRIVTEE